MGIWRGKYIWLGKRMEISAMFGGKRGEKEKERARKPEQNQEWELKEEAFLLQSVIKSSGIYSYWVNKVTHTHTHTHP